MILLILLLLQAPLVKVAIQPFGDALYDKSVAACFAEHLSAAEPTIAVVEEDENVSIAVSVQVMAIGDMFAQVAIVGTTDGKVVYSRVTNIYQFDLPSTNAFNPYGRAKKTIPCSMADKALKDFQRDYHKELKKAGKT